MTELPSGWISSDISTISRTIQYGYTASAETDRVGPRLLRITDIQEGQVEWPDVPFCTIDEERFKDFKLIEGDIVFARTGGTVGKSFLIRRIPEDAVFASYLIRVTCGAGIEPEFLYWFFQSGDYWEQVGIKKGGLQGNVNATTLGEITLSIPPTKEQRRIADKIEELFGDLDAGVESLTRAKARLTLYRQSVLKAAFEGRLTADWRAENPDKREDPDTLLARIQDERAARYKQALDDWQEVLVKWRDEGEEGKKPAKPKRFPEPTGEVDFPEDVHPPKPETWLWFSVGDLAEVTGGLTKNQKRKALPKKAKYLRVANVYANRFELDDVQEIGLSEDEIRKTFLKSGDLLIVEGNGSVEQIGRMALWRKQLKEVSHQNHLIRARFLSPIDPLFALMFFMSPWGRKLVVKKASSTSGLHTLSISKVSALPCPVPHIDEQREIVKRLEAELSNIDALEAQIEDGLARSKALRQSILKRAFAGQLVAQDPNDEPAHLLLERIKAEKATAPKAKRRKRSA